MKDSIEDLIWQIRWENNTEFFPYEVRECHPYPEAQDGSGNNPVVGTRFRRIL
ncbi:hypothetical protein MJD09_13490 [bacterium]|nr:hypothetical protein [bacterium]